MPGNDRGQKEDSAKYPTSFQQLMAQRYPQPDRGSTAVPGPFPQPPNLPTARQAGSHQHQHQQQQQQHHQQQQQQHQQHHQRLMHPQSQRQQMNPQQYHSGMSQQLQQQGSSNASSAPTHSHGSPGSVQRPTKGMPSPPQNLFTNAPAPSSSKTSPSLTAARPSLSSVSSKQTHPNSAKTSGASTKKDSSSRHAGHSSGIAFNTPQQKQNLAHCDWNDKVLWATRLILGGNSINGFLRATATAQRIKKQRARQLALTKKTAAAAAAAAAGTTLEEVDPEKAKDNAKKAFDQQDEEKLKKDIMNPRTAKKIKSELEAGLEFCVTVHNLLRGVIFEVDPEQSPFLPTALIMEEEQPPPTTPSGLTASAFSPSALFPSSALNASTSKQGILSHQQSGAFSSVPTDSSIPWAVKSNTAPGRMGALQAFNHVPSTKHSLQAQQRPTLPTQTSSSIPNTQSNKTTASPGNPGGSSLRKMRKKKLPPSNEPPANLPEFDGSGKRNCTKKEHNYRLFEVLRFRPLRQGDFVAARLTSRDLWILARVLKDYSGFDMPSIEFLNLSDARRDAVFRDRVLVKDVEEKDDGGSAQVARSLALPLPRTYSEAAEWGQRIKKGSRVYAMYPQTTSLYSATVIDSTTYCRDDDDIIVVEFDGEEQDATGQVPKYHIPVRFVTLIPREFPAAQANTPAGRNKRKGGHLPMAAPPKREKKPEDDIFGMDFESGDGLGNFDSLELDFDKPLEADEEQDDFPPIL